uniref:Secretin n=1 Tax=Chelonoidis abingdonii TaxID=106734 RepID=A0A8C0IU89_CHEAB
MASLLTGLRQLVISVVVLSQLSATFPALERAQRHADGVFNSELSKMNENAYVQKLVKSLVGLNQRYQRHSDGMFTSELSKMRGNAQVQKLIKSLVGYKRRLHYIAVEVYMCFPHVPSLHLCHHCKRPSRPAAACPINNQAGKYWGGQFDMASGQVQGYFAP